MHSTQKLQITRKQRTSEFRERVEREWRTTYLDFIKQYMDKPDFNWFNLTSNPNLDPQYIFDNPHLPWDFHRLITRPDISIETLIEKYGTVDVFWTVVLNREDMTMEYIDAHPEYPWPYSDIHSLKTLSIDFIKKHEAEVDFWNCLQFHNGYTLKEFLTAFPDHAFEPDLIYRTGMTADEAIETDDTILEVLAKNTRKLPNICDLVVANPDLKWDWTEISLNPHLTVPFMRKYRKQIKWDFLTSVIPKSVIRDNPRLPWDYKMYCYRKDLSRSELFEHITSYTDIFQLGSHSQIRFSDFQNDKIIKLDINSVSYNKFELEKQKFITEKYSEYLAAYRVQQYHNLVVSAPEYVVCRKRICRDYDDAFTEDGCLKNAKY
jgi:hypothetical protein